METQAAMPFFACASHVHTSRSASLSPLVGRRAWRSLAIGRSTLVSLPVSFCSFCEFSCTLVRLYLLMKREDGNRAAGQTRSAGKSRSAQPEEAGRKTEIGRRGRSVRALARVGTSLSMFFVCFLYIFLNRARLFS